MKNILLLEDLPEIRAWLKVLIHQVFPDAQISESARVHDALGLVSAVKFDLVDYLAWIQDGSGGWRIMEVVECTKKKMKKMNVRKINENKVRLFEEFLASLTVKDI